MNFGQAIKMVRSRRGLSLAEVAKQAGYSASYLSMLESGARKDPTVSTLKKIATALNVPLGILFFLGAEADELGGLDKDLSRQLAAAALEFLREPAQHSLI